MYQGFKVSSRISAKRSTCDLIIGLTGTIGMVALPVALME